MKTTPLFCQSCRDRTPHKLGEDGAWCKDCGRWRARPVVKLNRKNKEVEK